MATAGHNKSTCALVLQQTADIGYQLARRMMQVSVTCEGIEWLRLLLSLQHPTELLSIV